MASMEQVRKAVKRALESPEFQATLVAVHVEHGGAPENVVQAQQVSASETFTTDAYPYIELSGNMSRNTRNDQTVIDLLHEVTVFWYERGDDTDVLEDSVNRAMWAIRKFFENDFMLEDISSAPIYLGDDNYSPFVPASQYEARPFVKAGMTVLYVRTFN